jgi:hypothetical protein
MIAKAMPQHVPNRLASMETSAQPLEDMLTIQRMIVGYWIRHRYLLRATTSQQNCEAAQNNFGLPNAADGDRRTPPSVRPDLICGRDIRKPYLR